MSEKDNKTAMQILLIACAFALILLYLHFTKGACWEMSKCARCLLKILVFIVFALMLVSIYICIFNDNEKCNTIVLCNDKLIFYVSKNCSQIPNDIEKIIVRNIEDLEKLASKETKIKDIYILNPTGKISAKTLTNFKNAKIHFCKIGETFCIEKIIDSDANKNN